MRKIGLLVLAMVLTLVISTAAVLTFGKVEAKPCNSSAGGAIDLHSCDAGEPPLVVEVCKQGDDVRVSWTWHDLPSGAQAGGVSYYAGDRIAPLANTKWEYQVPVDPRPVSGHQVMWFTPPPDVPSPNDGPINFIQWKFTTADNTQQNANVFTFPKCGKK